MEYAMNPEGKQEPATEEVEPKRKSPGKVRVKATHVSPLVREIIVDRFRQRSSTEDIAEEMRIPIRTVTDILLAAVLRKSPTPERGTLLPLRRVG
jgi:hypothetical protein